MVIDIPKLSVVRSFRGHEVAEMSQGAGDHWTMVLRLARERYLDFPGRRIFHQVAALQFSD